jgi:hypothetical protein
LCPYHKQKKIEKLSIADSATAWIPDNDDPSVTSMNENFF